MMRFVAVAGKSCFTINMKMQILFYYKHEDLVEFRSIREVVRKAVVVQWRFDNLSHR